MSVGKKYISYRDLIWVFTKVGCQAFGGWTTTALQLEEELVRKRKLLEAADIHGASAYAQIIPGGTQTAIVSGVSYKLKGMLGSAVATTFYLLPSTIMIGLFSFAYFHYLRDTQLTAHLNVTRSVVAGIMLANAYKIGKHHATQLLLWLLVVVAFLMKAAVGLNSVFVILIFAVGGLGLSWHTTRKRS